MLDWLYHFFSAVCGQNPEHTWVPGGIRLPCCERCMGLYAGACAAAVLHVSLRPKLTGRLLEVHGAFLLLMAPFGFHWLPQDPLLRTLTGMLFGFGVVTYAWLPLSDSAVARIGNPRYRRIATCRARPGAEHLAGSNPVMQPAANPGYALGLGAALAAVPALAALGGRPGAYLLCGLVCAGALALGALLMANAALGVAGLTGLARKALV